MNFKVKPITRPSVDPAALSAFADGANTIISQNAWDGKDDKRRVNSFLLRLTDYEMAKLKHIGTTTHDSMQEFCRKAIRQALDNII